MVEATINYLAAMAEKPYYYLTPPPAGERWRNTSGDARTVPIRDARQMPALPSLDREGFELVERPTAVEDLYDHEQIRDVYYPEIEELIRSATGARRVMVFDHNVRNAERAERKDDLSQSPVRFVHCDYTEGSGPQRVRDLLPEEAERLLERRFAVVNAWRPIRGPVVDSPLAFCDAGSVDAGDVMATDLRYADRTGEIYSYTFGEDHRWFYYPRMEAQEVLLLKCYDSDPSVARFVAHTAFDDPTAPKDAPARESVEARALVFY